MRTDYRSAEYQTVGWPVPSWGGVAMAVGLAVFGVSTLAAVSLYVLRDDLFVHLMTRQAQMQLDYEDRITALRGQIDRLATRKLFDQDTLESKLHVVLARQATLESRTAMVAALAEGAGLNDPLNYASSSTTRVPKSPPQTAQRAPAAPSAQRAPALASRGDEPTDDVARPDYSKPRPVGMEIAPVDRGFTAPALRLDRGADASGVQRDPLSSLPAATRIEVVANSVERLETEQVRALAAIGRVARERATRLGAALSGLGLRVDRFSAAAPARGVGGPFVPFKLNAASSTFEREVLRLQDDVRAADRLRRAMARIPLRRPLGPGAETTSGFGSRSDPFLGRPAFHGGVDFRDAYGAPVRATSAGKVISAGRNGGYGNMVEIDHGAGITTRYAHMSAILVSEGQHVEAGTVVGRLGSTGRSTGPHLHYEVRIDDDPVDPMRFLRTGARLLAAR